MDVSTPIIPTVTSSSIKVKPRSFIVKKPQFLTASDLLYNRPNSLNSLHFLQIFDFRPVLRVFSLGRYEPLQAHNYPLFASNLASAGFFRRF